MKVARLHASRDIRLADEPAPEGGLDLGLVRVTAVGICGSDVHWWTESGIGDARLLQPLVLGHEIAGVIAAGPDAGTRVAVDPAIPCGSCPTCRTGYRNLCPQVLFAGHGRLDGGLREQLSWPTALLHRLPDELSDTDGALLEPLGVALHAVDLGHLPLGGTAAVIGCGPIGLFVLQLLRLAGAARVAAFDPLAHRRRAAIRLGSDQALDPADCGYPAAPGPEAAGPEDPDPGYPGPDSSEPADPHPAGLDREGVDVAFEVAGTDSAVRLAVALVRPGGRVVLAGIPGNDQTSFRASVARRKGLTIAMSRRMNDTYPRAIRLLASGRIEAGSLVTHRFPLRSAAEAMRAAARRDGLKVVVEPSSPSAPCRSGNWGDGWRITCG